MKAADLNRAWSERERRERLTAKRACLAGSMAAAWGILTTDELLAATGGVDATEPETTQVSVVVNKAGYCFTAQTPVHVPGGTMPIWTLDEGDRILTFDAAAGRVREGRVAGLNVHQVTTPLVTLESGGERIAVTPTHQFHDADGWQAAEYLGSRCLDLRQKARPVALVAAGLAHDARVYNVRVEEFGSYFVGCSGLWVRDH